MRSPPRSLRELTLSDSSTLSPSSSSRSSSHRRRSPRSSWFSAHISGHFSFPESAWIRGSRTATGRSLGGRIVEQCSRHEGILLRHPQRPHPQPCLGRFQPRSNGPPGVGKSTLCQELIREAFMAGLRCLYVVTNNPIALVKEQLRDMGVAPVARTEPVIFVDMYSWLLGERSPERFQIDNASDVAALSVVLTTAAETSGDKSFINFDTLSTLLAYNTEDLTVRFMKSHLARMKKHGNVGVYPIETGIHSNSFYNEVKADFDGVLELKLEEMDGELRRFIRVYRYRGSHETKWFRLLIGPNRDLKIY